MSGFRGGVRYDPIVVSAESTFVAEYVSESADEAAYQSEAALERGFISVLQARHELNPGRIVRAGLRVPCGGGPCKGRHHARRSYCRRNSRGGMHEHQP